MLTKPKKKIILTETATYDFNHASKKVSINSFLDWVKQTVPKDAEDVTLELIEEWLYDDCYVALELGWKSEINNSKYEKQLKKYNKQLKKLGQK